jgi:hypothetical protein
MDDGVLGRRGDEDAEKDGDGGSKEGRDENHQPPVEYT